MDRFGTQRRRSPVSSATLGWVESPQGQRGYSCSILYLKDLHQAVLSSVCPSIFDTRRGRCGGYQCQRRVQFLKLLRGRLGDTNTLRVVLHPTCWSQVGYAEESSTHQPSSVVSSTCCIRHGNSGTIGIAPSNDPGVRLLSANLLQLSFQGLLLRVQERSTLRHLGSTTFLNDFSR